MTREEFVKEIRELSDSFQDDHAMSVAADVSVPTIRNWKSGKSVPHEYMRDGIIRSLKEEV